MRKKMPPVWLCTVILAFVLVWRMMGAPLSITQWEELRTPFWQAGILLPSRMMRIWSNWFDVAAATTMDRESSEREDAEAVWLNVYVHDEKKLTRMTLQGYVCGVIAQEMPAAYHMEALKAQAVAARTRAVAQMKSTGCTAHPGADICTDSTHCQGYATMQQCREKWGNEYEVYRERILAAESQTRGEILTYEGKPISVFYHAISGGQTEDAQAVFSRSLPYLVSVESPGEENMRGFTTDTLISYEEISSVIAKHLDETISVEDVRKNLAILSYTNSGRVKTIQMGQLELDAEKLRELLGLRSTLFSISADEQGIHFFQRGYGHGVGMSQAGANAMASRGYTYDAILLHYYTGVTLEKE